MEDSLSQEIFHRGKRHNSLEGGQSEPLKMDLKGLEGYCKCFWYIHCIFKSVLRINNSIYEYVYIFRKVDKMNCVFNARTDQLRAPGLWNSFSEFCLFGYGTDRAVYEPNPSEGRFYSHKLKLAVLRYEIGICVDGERIVSVNGPYRCVFQTYIEKFYSVVMRTLRTTEKYCGNWLSQIKVCLTTRDSRSEKEWKLPFKVPSRNNHINIENFRNSTVSFYVPTQLVCWIL